MLPTIASHVSAPPRGTAAAASGDGALHVVLNGVPRVLLDVEPETTLAGWLRETERCIGVKLGCEVGACGSCTVVLSEPDGSQRRPVVSCLTPLAAVDGLAVTTVEGAAMTDAGQAVQACMANDHATQCGFCTPGFVMALFARLDSVEHPPATPIELERAVAGNVCRCTGYRPIATAASAAAAKLASVPKPTPSPPASQPDNNDSARVLTVVGNRSRWIAPTDLSHLCSLKAEHRESGHLVGGATGLAFSALRSLVPNRVFLSTSKVPELVDVRLSERGLECGAGANLLSIHAATTAAIASLTGAGRVAETRSLAAFMDCLEGYAWGSRQLLGAGTLGGAIGCAPSYSSFLPLLCALNSELRIARTSGSGGVTSEVVTVSPELVQGGSLQLDTSAVIVSVLVRLNETSEYVGVFKAEQHAKKDDSNLSVALCCALTAAREVVSARGFVGGVSQEPAELPLAVLQGSVLDEVTLLSAAERGQATVLREVGDTMAALTAAADEHAGGRVSYRRVLCCVFVLRFLLRIARMLTRTPFPSTAVTSAVEELPSDCPINGTQSWSCFSPADESRPAPVGSPVKHLAAEAHVSGTATFTADIGIPQGALHARFVTSTRAHAKVISLDATACYEIPGFIRLLDGGTIGASNRATLEGYGELLAFDGSASDSEVVFFGQTIALCIAETEAAAQAAARAVVVSYVDLPAVVTVAEALEQGSLYDMSLPPFSPNFGRIEHGNTTVIVLQQLFSNLNSVDLPRPAWHYRETDSMLCAFCALCQQALASADIIVQGNVNIGSQEHAYMEPWGCLVTPNSDDNGVTVQCPTQGAAAMQSAVAAALGCGLHAVRIQSRRVGGGFGGKEYQQCNVLAATAVAAQLTRRPIRMMLSRSDDMLIKGGRHAFLGKYKLGATAEGRIVGMEVELVANGGAWLSSSMGILANATLKGFTTYRLPSLRATGAIARTNFSPSSIFRGAGQPQTAFIMESAMEALCQRIAPASLPRGLAIRRINLVADGDVAPFGQLYRDVPLDRCYDELYEEADLEARCAAMEAFNATSRWKKRGLAVVPTVRHVSLGKAWDNQGLCLLNLYTDGTVLVHTGGIEVGQGLHTKIAQVVAAELRVGIGEVRVAEVSTDSVPNTSATAGSTGADLNAAAAIDACRVLLERLAPVREALGNGATMAQVAAEARARRIPLQATGFHASDIGGFDWETGQSIVWDGMKPAVAQEEAEAGAIAPQGASGDSTVRGRVKADLADYFAVGVAAVEVLLDVMTGDYIITRADVTVDAGQSLNPALDVGQVEGAFMQGVGYHTTEEIIIGSSTSHQWLPQGVVHTTTPDTYRVPTMANTPRQFNTRLLAASSNSQRKAVFSSKGVGEVSCFLGSAVYFAIRSAVQAARLDAGRTVEFELGTPATADRVRLACEDAIVSAAAGGLTATHPVV